MNRRKACGKIRHSDARFSGVAARALSHFPNANILPGGICRGSFFDVDLRFPGWQCGVRPTRRRLVALHVRANGFLPVTAKNLQAAGWHVSQEGAVCVASLPLPPRSIVFFNVTRGAIVVETGNALRKVPGTVASMQELARLLSSLPERR